MNSFKLHGKQDGAALVVGLVLLVVVTVLAVSGMNTATTELAMARNDQNYENAFQAAETGLENALAQGRLMPPFSSRPRRWCLTAPSVSVSAAVSWPITSMQLPSPVPNARALQAAQQTAMQPRRTHKLSMSLVRKTRH